MARIMPVEPSIAVLLRPKLKAANKKSLPRLTEEQISKFTFRCQECMIGFRRRGMLVNHLAKVSKFLEYSKGRKLTLLVF